MIDGERDRIRQDAMAQADILARVRELERDRDDIREVNRTLVSTVASLTMEKNEIQKKLEIVLAHKATIDKYQTWFAVAVVIGAAGILFGPFVRLWNILNEFATRSGQ